MPVEHRKPGTREHPKHDELVNEIVRHLKGGENLPSEPRIVEEEQRLTDSIHVYVFWKEWESVKEEERSAIILDAYKEALGQIKMLKITVAMGVTPLEAKQLGIA